MNDGSKNNISVEKRIKIAESQGWHIVSESFLDVVATPTGYPPNNDKEVRTIPDYFNDRDAIHGAISNSIIDKRHPETNHQLDHAYECNLEVIVFGSICQSVWPAGRAAKLTNAPAEQCAEAYGVTLNLW